MPLLLRAAKSPNSVNTLRPLLSTAPRECLELGCDSPPKHSARLRRPHQAFERFHLE